MKNSTKAKSFWRYGALSHCTAAGRSELCQRISGIAHPKAAAVIAVVSNLAHLVADAFKKQG
jgi:hypothetical protein